MIAKSEKIKIKNLFPNKVFMSPLLGSLTDFLKGYLLTHFFGM